MAVQSHVRVNVKTASRRIIGERGRAGETLCGAPVTSIDLGYSDAVRASAGEREQWISCDVCRSMVERQRSDAISRPITLA